ncbi:hypothetical protein C8F04DRAFT_1356630 [Mycena alexandri]|uniref:Uncharacterized protein n=1 Tax=Mycena alexandri TaxID=1745969 RepID=A0AAD6XDR3_9AGAR|nr:hypothetical protein C8F04DRAFT_1356630 [Mycena alexandri]
MCAAAHLLQDIGADIWQDVDIRPELLGFSSPPPNSWDTLSASEEVSGTIGYKICDVDECCGPGAQVLYNGPYTPTLHRQTIPGQPSFYQNFAFPSPFFIPEPVEINFVHFFDIGAGENIPFVETVSVDFNIV